MQLRAADAEGGRRRRGAARAACAAAGGHSTTWPTNSDAFTFASRARVVVRLVARAVAARDGSAVLRAPRTRRLRRAARRLAHVDEDAGLLSTTSLHQSAQLACALVGRHRDRPHTAAAAPPPQKAHARRSLNAAPSGRLPRRTPRRRHLRRRRRAIVVAVDGSRGGGGTAATPAAPSGTSHLHSRLAVALLLLHRHVVGGTAAVGAVGGAVGVGIGLLLVGVAVAVGEARSASSSRNGDGPRIRPSVAAPALRSGLGQRRRPPRAPGSCRAAGRRRR